jgi:tetratricopeptide (TPR) repeat protein
MTNRTLFAQASSALPKNAALILGSVISLGASLAYLFYGFQPLIFAAWALGIAICGHPYFYDRKVHLNTIGRPDTLILMALYVVSLPVYLWSVYNVPFHLNSDETVLLSVEQESVKNGIVDVFGLSDYFGFMYFPFLLQGWLAHLLGGVDLYHVRLLNAFTGTVIVACSYVFFRVINLPRALAVAATLFVCFNHSLIVLSRIASRINGGLLLELLALTTLFEGLKKKCLFTTYLGGFLTGVCFYAYYSARVTLPVWLLFLLLLYSLKQNSYTRKELLRFLLVFLLSFALTVAPFVAAQIRQPEMVRDANAYQRRSCLLYPEAQIDAKVRWEAKTIAEGVFRSVLNGLTVFNNTTMDQAWIYPHRGYGFVEPVSGLLVWIGFIRLLMTLGPDISTRFALVGFLFQLLFFSFITYPTPNYTRLLVILPFAGYFIAQGIDAIASFANSVANKLKGTHGGRTRGFVFACIILSVVLVNLYIVYDYACSGFANGDDIGSTARYLEARNSQSDYLFIMSASPQYPYFIDYSAYSCYGHMRAYVSPQQDVKVLAPEDLTTITIIPPFTIFMNGALWELNQDRLRQLYPKLIVHKIAAERDLVAIEDSEILPNSKQIHDAYKRWNDYPSKMNDALYANNTEEAKRLGLDYLGSPFSAINGAFFKSQILRALGDAYAREHQFEKAQAYLLEASAIREKLKSTNSADAADTARSLSLLYANWKKWPQSEYYARKAVAIRESVLKGQPVDWIDGLVYDSKLLGVTLWKQGKFDAAEKIFQSTLSRCRLDKGEQQEKEELVQDLAVCRKEHLAAPTHDR